jgi:type IV secretory pathway TraG/TraD family ATPase VirD4
MIAPATMVWMSDAIGASRTILLSMNKTWVNRQGEFFVESPINFLAALIWWLRKHRDGIFCTLPHAIELAQIGYDKLFTILSVDPEIQNLINAFKQAYLNNSMELVDSQVSSAKIPLSRLSSPDLYYILTGNDCTLDINDPAAPKIICLGGDPPRQEALAPVLSLYIDRINKLVNRPGRHCCALVCDEFATIRASSVLTTIATARSNNIIPILAVQDLSQLRTQYSREEADLILNITGNLICGQVGGETARWVSERFPGTMQYKTTVSVNRSDTSISKSEQMGSAISPATIATLSSGQFVGITADDPDKELTLKAFHARIIRDPKVLINKDQPGWKTLPVIRPVTIAEVEENFRRVKREVLKLVDAEVKRIMSDPDLVKMVVKR